MTNMTHEERKEAVENLEEICVEIGCSGLHPILCNETPHKCDIIRKLICPNGVLLVNGKWVAKE